MRLKRHFSAFCLHFLALPAVADFYIAPHIQNITKDGATIIWETPDASQETIEYGPVGALDAKASDTESRKIHRVRMTGLEPGKKYAYRVKAGDAVHESTFITAPAEEREVVFVVIGDSRRWEDTWEKTGMREHVMQWKPEFFLNMGDLVRDGHQYEQWPEHFGRFADISDSLWIVTARGNHEGSQKRDTERDWFAQYHDMPGEGEPYASFDWGNCHFTLASYEDIGGKDAWKKTGDWLDQHLDNVNKTWVITTQHYPVYCTGYDSVDQSRKELGENPAGFAEVLDKHNVDLNISGHTHIFERQYPIRGGKRDDLTGVHYLVNGGDINANYPDWFTATKDNKESMAKPTYTLFHAKQDRLEGRTFAWSKKDNAVKEIDYYVIWKDEATPKAVVDSLPGLEGDALVNGIREVAAMQYSPAAPALLPYLESTDPALRQATAKALALLGAEAVAEPLHALIADADPVVARGAARSIEVAMPESMAKEIAKDVQNEALDAQVREHLVGALQFHAEAGLTTKTMLDLLEKPETPVNVRRRAAYALGVTADKGNVRGLVKQFKIEPDTYTTLTLAWKLGELTGQRVDVDDDGLVARSKPGQRAEFASKWN